MTAPFIADNVRIRETPETLARKFAGRRGVVFGFTTPSLTKVDVVGSPRGDYALSVNFDDTRESVWFAADLVEFIDHAGGSQISIAGKTFERDHKGAWHEVDARKRSWWQLWK